MSDRVWQIGICGTFDVANYGDLLFPLLAEAELTKRLGAVRLHRFSYHDRKPPDWPYEVTSLAALSQVAPALDGVLIGGGFLIRFDKEVAPGYGPPTPAIPHPAGYWLTPALIALQRGIPLVWNAPGMHCNEIPAWAVPLVSLALRHSNYIAVRDEPSRAALAPHAAPMPIRVVPDTAFGLPHLLPRETSPAFEELRQATGLTAPYIVIQAALGLEEFMRFTGRHRERLQKFQFLALPIGPVLGDHESILEAALPGLVRLPRWPHPALLAEVIGRAAGVVGHSYHLLITALTAGVPVYTPVDLSRGKYSALSRFETIFPLPAESEAEPDRFLSRLGQSAPSIMAQTAQAEVDLHWDRVAQAIRAGSSTTGPGGLDLFWQTLPGLLESGALRAEALSNEKDGALAALRARRAEQDERLDELERLLALSRAEVAAREARLAALDASRSWKLTAPLRSLKHHLQRALGR